MTSENDSTLLPHEFPLLAKIYLHIFALLGVCKFSQSVRAKVYESISHPDTGPGALTTELRAGLSHTARISERTYIAFSPT